MSNQYAIQINRPWMPNGEEQVCYGPFGTIDAAREFAQRAVIENAGEYQIHKLVPYIDTVDKEFHADLKKSAA